GKARMAIAPVCRRLLGVTTDQVGVTVTVEVDRNKIPREISRQVLAMGELLEQSLAGEG
ncbi:MAG: hypothetical protein GY720_13680, partial [bacterium]|nr:hypothetical protein [bacterium]